jgi:hypothetical protein
MRHPDKEPTEEVFRMYCPHCGAETAQGLNYCNRCGGNLSPLATTNQLAAGGQQETRHAISPGMAWAVGVTMLLVVGIGLAAVFGTISDLAHFIPPDAIVALAITGSVTVLGSVFLLTRFWMRLLLPRASKKEAAPQLSARAPSTAGLGPARPGTALPDAHFTSVTEHTTRTLKKG